ncbi:unnamed protein product [Anisakis simplex]|uniref:THO complex subunit 1 (inferred by orthology to a human protein) n=1 Tax=Anisakis simplex TaxID=6269 RepID=A0A0M3J1W6_ANISI|nr:unnamed protein product [Anisakis simplex]
MEPTEELVNINIEEIYAVVNQMKENGKASELIKGSVEEMLHRKALQIAQLNNIESIDKNMRNLLNIVFQIAKEDVCTKSLTVTIIQDIFDVLSIDDCEYLFSIVEDNLSLWKNGTRTRTATQIYAFNQTEATPTVHGLSLSPSLSSLASLCCNIKRSGLCLVEAECESAAKIEPKESLSEENIEEDIETGEIKENCDIPIDFALYAKFWQLQTFFTAPNSCYDKSKWKIFHQVGF